VERREFAVEAELDGVADLDVDGEFGCLEPGDVVALQAEQPVGGGLLQKFGGWHRVDDGDLEQSVFHVGLGLAFGAEPSAVADEREHRVALPEPGAVGAGDVEREPVELRHQAEGGEDVREHADALLEVVWSLTAGFGGEAGDTRVHEQPLLVAVADGRTEVDAPGVAGHHLERVLDAGDADVAGEVVAGAAGDDADGGVVEGVGVRDAVHDLVDGAVAAGGRDDRRAVGGGVPRETAAVPRFLGLDHLEAVGGGERPDPVGVVGVAAHGIEHDHPPPLAPTHVGYDGTETQRSAGRFTGSVQIGRAIKSGSAGARVARLVGGVGRAEREPRNGERRTE
jgi:hypothetical protein